VVNSQAAFFKELGRRIKKIRESYGYKQEDMISMGFNTRHWQYIESGRPFKIPTLFRVSAALKMTPERLIRGLSKKHTL